MSSSKILRDLGLLAGSLALVFVVAALGGLLTAAGLGSWYDSLPKPSWTPPPWVFGPVWTTLYLLQGLAAWLAARRAWEAPVRRALAVHVGQLALEVAWSAVFFTLRAPRAATAVIVLVLAALVAEVAAFRRVSGLAAALVVPTLLWVAFASALCAAIAFG